VVARGFHSESRHGHAQAYRFHGLSIVWTISTIVCVHYTVFLFVLLFICLSVCHTRDVSKQLKGYYTKLAFRTEIIISVGLYHILYQSVICKNMVIVPVRFIDR